MKHLLTIFAITILAVSCTKTDSGIQSESEQRAHHVKGDGGTTAPAQVTGVTATALDSTRVFITWNGVADATEYYVFRNGEIVGIVVFPNSYTDNNSLTPGTTYTYEVAASNKGTLGAKSTSVTVTTPY